ncbi:MAG TPA: MSMEG_4193 family putative phosphomutase [Bryobacteraceae bacterium]|nr:MSMEG_4193 family putative phosphomutase [Bryobacteraceae bacterium]
MSTTVLVIRHGYNDWVGRTLAGWTPGVHLNARGREQAEQLCRRLSGVPIQAIYSSPLERTRETAGPLSRQLGLEVRVCDALGELRLGEWTGRKLCDLENDPLWRRFNTQRSTTRIPGGEHTLEVQTRMAEAFEGIRRSHPNAVVAVFSHGDPIRAILLHYLGMPLDLMHRIEIEPASVSVVKLHEWGPQVMRMNDMGVLP